MEFGNKGESFSHPRKAKSYKWLLKDANEQCSLSIWKGEAKKDSLAVCGI